MKTFLATLAFSAALAASAAAFAHDNDAACLVPGAQIVPVAGGQFSITPARLAQFEQEQGGRIGSPGGGGVCTPMSCGIVDDHWAIASKLIAQECERIAPGSVPQVISPSVFNDAVNHHVGYSYGGTAAVNLTGRCVYCRAPARTSPALKSNKAAAR